MTFPPHLPIDIEKIQSGVSVFDARNCARHLLEEASDSAALDADLIVAHVLRRSRLSILGSPQEVLEHNQAQNVRALLSRRLSGEPIAYLLGEKEFYGLEFKVSPDVLIPRPDTEILVEAALEAIRGQNSPRVLDVCTGSGCIAISIAHNSPAQVAATEISLQALEIAKENARRTGVSIDFYQGDLLAPVATLPPFDLIVSNPPYIPAKDIPGLMVDVRDFEPHLALRGEGEDGLGLHCKILNQSLKLLKPGGIVLMEIGDGQAEILFKESFSGFSRASFLKDYAGVKRVAKYVREGVIDG